LCKYNVVAESDYKYLGSLYSIFISRTQSNTNIEQLQYQTTLTPNKMSTLALFDNLDQFLENGINYVPCPEPEDHEPEDCNCSICLETYSEDESIIKTQACNHVFHKECLTHWLSTPKYNCPYCRTALLVRPPPAPGTFQGFSAGEIITGMHRLAELLEADVAQARAEAIIRLPPPTHQRITHMGSPALSAEIERLQQFITEEQNALSAETPGRFWAGEIITGFHRIADILNADGEAEAEAMPNQQITDMGSHDLDAEIERLQRVITGERNVLAALTEERNALEESLRQSTADFQERLTRNAASEHLSSEEIAGQVAFMQDLNESIIRDSAEVARIYNRRRPASGSPPPQS
jgi:hypothetical protein